MSKRNAKIIASLLVITFVVLSSAGLILQKLANVTYTGFSFPVLVIAILIVSVWPILGALVATRHPENPVGWLLIVAIFVAALDMFSAGYSAYDIYVYSGSLPGVEISLVWLSIGGAFPIAAVAFALVMLLFPTGRFPSSRWYVVALLATAAMISYVAIGAVRPGAVDPVSQIFVSNPLGVSRSLWTVLRPAWWTALLILNLCYAAAFLSLIIRLRRSQGDERQQIKWLVFPAALFGLTIPLLSQAIDAGNEILLDVGIALNLPGIMGIIIAVALAILRFRLYDIDTIVNRTLVYGLLTIVLALIYFASVIFLQQVFRLLTGQQSPLVNVVSTLLIASLFNPLRRRFQNIIDRRFFRRKYNLQLTLERFAVSARDEVDLEVLEAELLNIIDQSLQPRNVTLWLKKERG